MPGNPEWRLWGLSSGILRCFPLHLCWPPLWTHLKTHFPQAGLLFNGSPRSPLWDHGVHAGAVHDLRHVSAVLCCTSIVFRPRTHHAELVGFTLPSARLSMLNGQQPDWPNKRATFDTGLAADLLTPRQTPDHLVGNRELVGLWSAWHVATAGHWPNPGRLSQPPSFAPHCDETLRMRFPPEGQVSSDLLEGTGGRSCQVTGQGHV